VFIGEILANMTQVSDVAPGPLVSQLKKGGGGEPAPTGLQNTLTNSVHGPVPPSSNLEHGDREKEINNAFSPLIFVNLLVTYGPTPFLYYECRRAETRGGPRKFF
jgi:hypothetical protein